MPAGVHRDARARPGLEIGEQLVLGVAEAPAHEVRSGAGGPGDEQIPPAGAHQRIAAEVDGRRERARERHVAGRLVDRDVVRLVRLGAAEPGAPDVVAGGTELGEEDVGEAGALERRAAEIDGSSK